MMEWFDSLTHLQQVFLIFAVIGAVLFIIQLILMLVGGGDADADVNTGGGDVGGHADMGGGDADGAGDIGSEAHQSRPSSDISFKLLSFQGLTAFFMMFGLTGLAMSRGSDQGAGLSVLAGIAVGFACTWLIGKLFQFFGKLQSSGTLDLRNAVGQIGRVYLTIKPDAPGQIEVAVQGHLKIYDAVSESGIKIPTDARVEVTAVKGSTMVVKQI